MTCADKVIFITGFSKSCGKTAVFDYIAKNARGHAKIALLSLCADGNNTIITACKGDYIVTADSFLNASPVNARILEVFPYQTAVGKIVFAEVLTGGRISLAGPENNTQLAQIIEKIKTGFGIKTVFIDGALDRITQISSALKAFYIQVVKADSENLQSVIDKVKLNFVLSRLPIAKNDGKNAVYIDGAITSKKLTEVPKNIKTVIAADFSKFFLSYGEYLKFSKQFNFKLKNRLKLLFFSVNPYNIGRKEFLRALGDSKARGKIVFNPYSA